MLVNVGEVVLEAVSALKIPVHSGGRIKCILLDDMNVIHSSVTRAQERNGKCSMAGDFRVTRYVRNVFFLFLFMLFSSNQLITQLQYHLHSLYLRKNV
jgi:hypothetical protein